jgi:hypothetical protein
MAALLLTSPLYAQVKSSKPAPKSASRRTIDAAAALKQLDKNLQDKLQKAVATLVAEAKQLDNLNQDKAPVVFSRPHSAVKDWGADMAIPALLRMTDDFTKGKGKRFRDTYVRWHLMHTVKKLPRNQLNKAAVYLGQLTDAIPGPLRTAYVEEYKRDPESVYGEYTSLVHGPKLRMKIGYPPFEKYVYAPESFEHMNEKQRAEAAPVWKQAQALRKQYKEVYSPKARVFNDRIAKVNVLVREYQGEVVYQLVRTGDPNRLKQVFRAINKHARKKDSITGFDLLSYVYLAGIDGYLDQYDTNVRKQMGNALEKTARAVEKQWVLHGVYKRNFADYAFHMVETLKHGDNFRMQ